MNFQGYIGLTCFCKYVRVLNIPGLSVCPGLWISRFTQDLPISVNMIELWICVVMQSWKNSEYSTIPICQVFAYASITHSSEYAWIWLNSAWINCSDYGRVINMPVQSFTGFLTYLQVLNMAKLEIWPGCDYVRGIQGYEWTLVFLNAWVSFNMP